MTCSWIGIKLLSFNLEIHLTIDQIIMYSMNSLKHCAALRPIVWLAVIVRGLAEFVD